MSGHVRCHRKLELQLSSIISKCLATVPKSVLLGFFEAPKLVLLTTRVAQEWSIDHFVARLYAGR